MPEQQTPRTLSPDQLSEIVDHVNDTVLYLQARGQKAGAAIGSELAVTHDNVWQILDVRLAGQLLTAFKHLARVLGHLQSITDGVEAPEASALILAHLGGPPGRWPAPSDHQRRVIELIRHADPLQRMTIASSHPALVQAWMTYEDRGTAPLVAMADSN
ncbi:hypothetical protein [Tsukamurella pseudospumae]|uniref:DUF222 domain-containing protein n=1 Tax=Tsukamurella pseudospumae TaxID=239498 RepID=A0A137ZRS9_9ACTN|nr:hypothetical protein [Tsukamurella pseudospumae]KXP00891.1 hypothetical protein AXK61_12850 [Tsukamurella pseudospumae]